MGGLVLEVKGDFCAQVRSMLAQAGRAPDYLEIGLDSGVCYNPLHNDLDPYAVAYAIGTLLNNLFGKSTDPSRIRTIPNRRRISPGTDR